MKIKRLIPCLMAALLISGCGNNAVSENGSEETSISTTATSKTDTAVVTEKNNDSASTSSTQAPYVDPNVLTKEELDEYTALFNGPEYNGFLTKSFYSPKDLDWEKVLDQGGKITVSYINDEEYETFVRQTGYSFWEKKKLSVIRANDLKDFALKHTGENPNLDNFPTKWKYVEEYDSYYFMHYSSEDQTYTCISGTKEDDVYTLRFQKDGDSHTQDNADRIIKFTKDGDNLVLLSNEIQWEDGCDPDQTFDVVLKEGEEPVHFVTYQGVSGSARVYIIKDGNEIYRDSIYNNKAKIKTITAIGFFDFNADGVKDIVYIGESESGTNIALSESTTDQYLYETPYGLAEQLENDLGDNITISNIKKALLGDKKECKFDTYQEAFLHMAKLYNWQSGGYNFDLIYADDDDIPELLITAACDASLFRYEDGYLHCLMYHWTWGAMGNYGYEYVPRKGIFYNHNSDYCGAVRYTTYMLIHEGSGKELQGDYVVEEFFFNDKDGDGYPSDEELMDSTEMESYLANYYSHTNEELTEEQIEQKIDEFHGYELVSLDATKTYDELVAELAQ